MTTTITEVIDVSFRRDGIFKTESGKRYFGGKCEVLKYKDKFLVLDTSKTHKRGENLFIARSIICECDNETDAVMIADSLNMMER